MIKLAILAVKKRYLKLKRNQLNNLKLRRNIIMNMFRNVIKKIIKKLLINKRII